MKKLILLLALALGVEVKAQIVGGFIPQNSTKSFTAGNATFSNVIARGTLSVGSTATVTGAFKASSTMSLGSANLTGGNTGTVAVLSDALFNVLFQSSTANPADATTYYFGALNYQISSNSIIGLTFIPYNCSLVGWSYSTLYTPGATSETSTLSITGTTTVNLSTSLTYTSSTSVSNYNNSGLNVNFNAGDMINAKLITPTWATNPTNFQQNLILWFVRRS